MVKYQATVVKYACPFGYPDKPLKDQPINVSNLENPAVSFPPQTLQGYLTHKKTHHPRTLPYAYA